MHVAAAIFLALIHYAITLVGLLLLWDWLNMGLCTLKTPWTLSTVGFLLVLVASSIIWLWETYFQRRHPPSSEEVVFEPRLDPPPYSCHLWVNVALIMLALAGFGFTIAKFVEQLPKTKCSISGIICAVLSIVVGLVNLVHGIIVSHRLKRQRELGQGQEEIELEGGVHLRGGRSPKKRR